jgi:hypothetical protein
MHDSEDGPAHRAVADIQMRLVVKVDRYVEAGQVMDDVRDAMDSILAGRKGAKFDFIGFQTHPCKEAQMARATAHLVAPEDYLPEDVPATPDHAF